MIKILKTATLPVDLQLSNHHAIWAVRHLANAAKAEREMMPALAHDLRTCAANSLRASHARATGVIVKRPKGLSLTRCGGGL